MTYSVHNTSDWTLEALQPYVADITQAMGQLIERFPRDVTAESLWGDLLAGSKQLWLILDEEGAFVAFALTRIAVTAAGLKLVTMMDLAGRDFRRWWPVLGDTVEAWAREIGAHCTQIEGRAGWEFVTKKRGYEEQARLWRKEL